MQNQSRYQKPGRCAYKPYPIEIAVHFILGRALKVGHRQVPLPNILAAEHIACEWFQPCAWRGRLVFRDRIKHLCIFIKK